MGRFARFTTLSVIVLVFGLCPAAAAPLTLDDVVALLKAGVGAPIILKQVASYGVDFTVGVPEILRLKEAGAGDVLIDALMTRPVRGAADSPAAPGEAAQSFRIFKDKNERGEEVLHITNLDAQGRRIGGEVPPSEEALPNRYESGGRGTEAAREREYGVIGEAQAPVVVNVYPPSGPGTSEAGYDFVSPYVYRDPYAYLYPRGRLPGIYYGYWGTGPVPSPPGSYSHFENHHTHYGGFPRGCARPAPRGSLGPSYVAIGPASARAALPAMRANVRLGRAR